MSPLSPKEQATNSAQGWTRFADWKDLDSVSEEEWDKCWSANVKVPKALLSEARATFDANPDGGQMITTGSIAVCYTPTRTLEQHMITILYRRSVK